MENTIANIEEGMDALARAKDVLDAGLALLVEHDDGERAATLVSVAMDYLEKAQQLIDKAATAE